MTAPTIPGATIWRDHNTAGVPSSGQHDPDKSEIRGWTNWVEDSLSDIDGEVSGAVRFDQAQTITSPQKSQARDNIGLGSAATRNVGTVDGTVPDVAYVNSLLLGAGVGGALGYATLAALNADTTDRAQYQVATVHADSTAANNGIYQNTSATSTNTWVKIADNPASQSDLAAATNVYSLFPDVFFRGSAAIGRALRVGRRDYNPADGVKVWNPNFPHLYGPGAFEINNSGNVGAFRVWFDSAAAVQAGITTGSTITVGGICVVPASAAFSIAARFLNDAGGYVGVQVGATGFTGTGAYQTVSTTLTVPAGAFGVEIWFYSTASAFHVVDVDAAPGATFAATARVKYGAAVDVAAAKSAGQSDLALAWQSQIHDKVAYSTLTLGTGLTVGNSVARTDADLFTGFGQTFTTPGSLTPRNAVYIGQLFRGPMADISKRWDFIRVIVRTHATDPSAAGATVVAVGEIAIPREANSLKALVIPLNDPVSGKPTSFTHTALAAKYGIMFQVRSVNGAAYCGETIGTVGTDDGAKSTSYYVTSGDAETGAWTAYVSNPTFPICLCTLGAISTTRTYPPSGAQRLAIGPHNRNKAALRNVRGKVTNNIMDGTALRMVIGLIGDSWSTFEAYYAANLAKYLIAKYGDGGVGWFGLGFISTIAAPAGDARSAFSVSASSGTWTSNYHSGSTSPNISDARGVTSASVTLSNSAVTVARPALSDVKLHFTGTADGVIKWRWNGGAWSSNTNVQGTLGNQQTLTLTGFPTGTYTSAGSITLEIQVVSGTAILCGVDFQSASNGVVIHKLGSSGSTAADWVTSTADKWSDGIAALGLDAAAICLGVNDAASGAGLDAFMFRLSQIRKAIAAASDTTDVVFIGPPESPLSYQQRISVLAGGALSVADQGRDAFLNLQPGFGSAQSPSDYAYGSDNPMYLVDDTHPNTTAAVGIAREIGDMIAV